MEKVESAFSPEDRIGALEMQNLSVQDNRDFLVEHLRSLAKLPPGGDRPALAALLSEDEKL
jgi:argininosuccinate synthase